MTTFTLRAGTIVKFGTTTNQLYAILRNGILPVTHRAGFDSSDGATESPALIYVGELMAYFAASTAFRDTTSDLHQVHEEVLSPFVEALQNAHGEKPTVTGLDLIATQAGLPVILEITLGEDCEVLADTHFVDSEQAERSWKLWRSVAITRPDGIPSAWVKNFYFPRLLDFKDTTSARHPRMMEQTSDSALLVGGLMQCWHKDAPGELLLAYRNQYGRTNFSQSSEFSETGIERFFNLHAMLDPATRLLNQMSIWQDVDALAKKQNIPFANT